MSVPTWTGSRAPRAAARNGVTSSFITTSPTKAAGAIRATSTGSGSPCVHAERRRVDDDVVAGGIVRADGQLRGRDSASRAGRPAPRGRLVCTSNRPSRGHARRRQRRRDRRADAAAADDERAHAPAAARPLRARRARSPRRRTCRRAACRPRRAGWRCRRRRSAPPWTTSSSRPDRRDLVRHRDERAADVGRAVNRVRRKAGIVLGLARPSARRRRRCRAARNTGCRSSAP